MEKSIKSLIKKGYGVKIYPDEGEDILLKIVDSHGKYINILVLEPKDIARYLELKAGDLPYFNPDGGFSHDE